MKPKVMEFNHESRLRKRRFAACFNSIAHENYEIELLREQTANQFKTIMYLGEPIE